MPMTPRREKRPGQDPYPSSLGVDSECNKDTRQENTELSALLGAALDLQRAGDAPEAQRAALATLIDPQGLGFGMALFFSRAAEEEVLVGQAAARANPLSETSGLPASPEQTPGRTASLDDLIPHDQVVDQPGALAQAVRAMRVPLELGREVALLRGLRARAALRVAVGEDPLLRDLLEDRGAPCAEVILVPVRASQADLGVLVLGEVPDGPMRPARSMARAELLAQHLGLALERIQSRAARQDGIAAYEVIRYAAQESLGANNLPDILLATARCATQVAGAGRATVWLYDETTGELDLAAQHIALASDILDAAAPRFECLAQRCARQGGALLYPDLRDEPEMQFDSLVQPLPAVAVPLTAFGETVGVLAVLQRAPVAEGQRPHFTLQDEQLLGLLAAPVTLAIICSRLTDRQRETESRLGETQKILLDTERTASAGELSGRLIEELRQPLSAIASFAHRLEDRLPANDPCKAEAGIVAREVQKLEDALAQEMHGLTPGEPRMAQRQLNELVHESVAMVREELTGRGIFLEETYSEQVPQLLLDEDRIRQVMLNILHNSLASVHDGDTIRIETLREGDRALLEVANTGQQVPGEILGRLFVPFDVSRPAGKGLGLAVAQQVVHEHGGEISVRSEGEWGTIFTISFPIRSNQERRRYRDRRSGRDRRCPDEDAA